jgi:GDP-mannose transporter
MNDKKNEDFTVRMPESSNFSSSDRDAFKARSSPRRPAANSMPETFARLNNSPPVSILAYCLASISMTVVNKYVVSGNFWNLNFFYLAVQVSSLFRSEAKETKK